jgi:hypothetical protein
MAYVLLILINDELHKINWDLFTIGWKKIISSTISQITTVFRASAQHYYTLRLYLFSRKVFALDTFFPMADAFQEKYDPEGST